MTYPNQYYQPNYMPQYQNFQPQQRQEQLDQLYVKPYNYNFVREKGEAERWPIAPGNMLVFADQNGQYFYTKSLGFAPNDKPVFVTYKREDYVEPAQVTEQVEQNPLKDEFDKYKSSTELELTTLKNSLEELKQLINQRPHFNKNSKGGRD